MRAPLFIQRQQHDERVHNGTGMSLCAVKAVNIVLNHEDNGISGVLGVRKQAGQGGYKAADFRVAEEKDSKQHAHRSYSARKEAEYAPRQHMQPCTRFPVCGTSAYAAATRK